MCCTRQFAILVAVATLMALSAERLSAQTKGKTIPSTKSSETIAAPKPLPTTQKARPEAQPLRLATTPREEPVDPALEKILADWEQESSKVATLYCTFTKFRYNHKWHMEYRSEGQVVYKAPDHGVYWQKSSTITAKMQGRSVDLNNKPLPEPYQLEADKAERWICNGQAITQINEAEKTYQQHEIPADMRGKNIVEGPLPFLFGMKADAAKKRYWMKLAKHDKESHEIWINVAPKLKMDAANYQRATVVIDDTTFTPKAVRLIDPTGMEEIVHTFQGMKVNPKLTTKSDPFNPSLAGLKPIITEPVSVQKPAVKTRTTVKVPSTPVNSAQQPPKKSKG